MNNNVEIKQMNSNFQEKLALGNEMEQIVVSMLKEKGMYVLDTFAFSNGMKQAPTIENQTEKIIIPDVLVFSPEHGQCWVEVKYRKRAWIKRKDNTKGLLLSKRHVENYAKAQRATKIPVFIFFALESDGVIYQATLDRLLESCSIGEKLDSFYFPVHSFERFSEIPKVEEQVG